MRPGKDMEVRACARRNADLVRFPGALAGAQDRRVRRGKTAWKEDKMGCFAQPVSWLSMAPVHARSRRAHIPSLWSRWDVSEGDPACCPTGRWCRGRELNPHPPDFQSAALPAELPLHVPGLMYVIG